MTSIYDNQKFREQGNCEQLWGWYGRPPIGRLGLYLRFGPSVLGGSLVPSPFAPFPNGQLPLMERALPVPYLQRDPKSNLLSRCRLSAF